MLCQICNSPTQRRFQKHGYWVRECELCRHRRAEITPSVDHVDAFYGDDYFRGRGDGYPDYLGEAEILASVGRRYATLLQRYTTPGSVLDVGTAAGFVLKGFQESGWETYGIEPNPSMAEYARAQLGLSVDVNTLEHLEPSECCDRQCSDGCDLLSTVQVVAHFFDLRRAFQVAAEVVRPGGFWIIETWNRDSFVARVLGEHWHEYSPPSVLHWFSPKGIKHLAGQFGFTEVARGRPSKWLKSGHAKSLLKFKLGSSRLGRAMAGPLDVIPDDLSIPYPSWDLFWMLLQKGARSGS